MKTSKHRHAKKKVFAAVKEAAVILDMEIEFSSLDKGEIELFKGAGIFSFGNRIAVKIASINSLTTEIQISSRSAAQVQLIDWGTNDTIENEVHAEIRKILNS